MQSITLSRYIQFNDTLDCTFYFHENNNIHENDGNYNTTNVQQQKQQ